MDAREKVLYHQIHPLKLLTDWGSAFIAIVLFWEHQLLAALAVSIIPSIIVTALLVRWANLEPLKQSRLGAYIGQHMSHGAEATRMFGMVLMCFAAWYHVPLVIVIGLAVIGVGWGRGLLTPDS